VGTEQDEHGRPGQGTPRRRTARRHTTATLLHPTGIGTPRMYKCGVGIRYAPAYASWLRAEHALLCRAASDQITALEISQLTKAEHALMWTRVVRRIINTDPDKVRTRVSCVWHSSQSRWMLSWRGVHSKRRVPHAFVCRC
jgi:hypothetical protein